MSTKQLNKTDNIQKVLIIQTAFVGDVILATSLVEKLKSFHPDCQIDFLVRKGNEILLEGNPHISGVLIWDKKNKYSDLIRNIRKVRRSKYSLVVNVQRYFSTGLIIVLSRARIKSGFSKNPLSSFFDISVSHPFDKKSRIHEIERNQELISILTDNTPVNPRLYFTEATLEAVNMYKGQTFICVGPASVWNTKQYPSQKWIDLLRNVHPSITVFLVGGPSDHDLCESIRGQVDHPNMVNLAGKLNLSETAALIAASKMTFTNDSAPLHMASASNTPTCAIFCSTIPQFGFGPLAKKSMIVELGDKLNCRPCGMHGKKTCPEGHFKCALEIKTENIVRGVNEMIPGIFRT